MNVTTPVTAPDAPDAEASLMPGTAALSCDHQLALLTARAGLEPELAQRYISDPVSVLAEFGLPVVEPVYGDDFASAFEERRYGRGFGDTGGRLVIDHLDRPGSVILYGCATGMAPLPGEELVIDHLDRPGTGMLYGCATGMAPLPGEEAGSVRA